MVTRSDVVYFLLTSIPTYHLTTPHFFRSTLASWTAWDYSLRDPMPLLLPPLRMLFPWTLTLAQPLASFRLCRYITSFEKPSLITLSKISPLKSQYFFLILTWRNMAWRKWHRTYHCLKWYNNLFVHLLTALLSYWSVHSIRQDPMYSCSLPKPVSGI